ncbi:Ubiquitin homeostasis protein lub1 [Colletotrichum sp. SAR11_239]|nr:Ubiquitin homeostasis protein lub1 [Colletotrichum sp. SAR11_239]
MERVEEPSEPQTTAAESARPKTARKQPVTSNSDRTKTARKAPVKRPTQWNLDVEIEDGEPPLLMVYHADETPEECARKFLDDNELPLAFLEQLMNFIKKNVNHEEPEPEPVPKDRKIKTPRRRVAERSFMDKESLTPDREPWVRSDPVAQASNQAPATPRHPPPRRAVPQEDAGAYLHRLRELAAGGAYTVRPTFQSRSPKPFTDPFPKEGDPEFGKHPDADYLPPGSNDTEDEDSDQEMQEEDSHEESEFNMNWYSNINGPNADDEGDSQEAHSPDAHGPDLFGPNGIDFDVAKDFDIDDNTGMFLYKYK